MEEGSQGAVAACVGLAMQLPVRQLLPSQVRAWQPRHQPRLWRRARRSRHLWTGSGSSCGTYLRRW